MGAAPKLELTVQWKREFQCLSSEFRRYLDLLLLLLVGLSYTQGRETYYCWTQYTPAKTKKIVALYRSLESRDALEPSLKLSIRFLIVLQYW